VIVRFPWGKELEIHPGGNIDQAVLLQINGAADNGNVEVIAFAGRF
jgi:hypothetical protein